MVGYIILSYFLLGLVTWKCTLIYLGQKGTVLGLLVFMFAWPLLSLMLAYVAIAEGTPK